MWADSTGNFVPLPTHFADINATLDASCKPTIHWSNLTESDIHYYTIERAIGNDQFQPLDSILPTVNNGGRADYSFSDTATISGFNLYRIKAVENSGNFFYSIVLRINGCGGGRGVTEKPKLSIYPNPAQNGRFVLSSTDLPKGTYLLFLVSGSGVQKRISQFDHDGGALNKLFNLDWVTPGFYTLMLRSDNLLLSQKIVIAN
jgi:hypothetical protein